MRLLGLFVIQQHSHTTLGNRLSVADATVVVAVSNPMGGVRPTREFPKEFDMNCNCEILHRGTNLTTAGLLTVTNPNNIANFDDFNMILCLNPNNIITGAPVAYTVTINGTAVPILDVWGYPIRTDKLCPRKVYRGKYITGTGITPHITLANVRCTIQDALATAAVTTTDTTTGD